MIETLSDYERLNLSNQYRILEKLARANEEIDEAKRYDELATIVENGYAGLYGSLTGELSEEMTKEECSLVIDILDLYSVIYTSYSELKNPQLTESDIHFWGFDGNEEGYYYNFCNYILKEWPRFSEIAGGRSFFNSHCRRVNKYKSMITKWINMGRPYQLSEEEIKEILSAR